MQALLKQPTHMALVLVQVLTQEMELNLAALKNLILDKDFAFACV
jgi:hypothetical protein